MQTKTLPPQAPTTAHRSETQPRDVPVRRQQIKAAQHAQAKITSNHNETLVRDRIV